MEFNAPIETKKIYIMPIGLLIHLIFTLKMKNYSSRQISEERYCHFPYRHHIPIGLTVQ
jgi:hypothetical protein